MATSQSKGTGIDKVHLGTMGWSYAFWRGNLYPTSLKPEAYLTEYSKHFNSVELDNTFYRIPSANMVRNWEKQTPAHFLFAAKFPRVITHVKMLQDCEREAEAFIASMSQLHNKLGPLLLQFPPSFKPERFDLLRNFLSILPKSCRYAVEVRNKNLLEDKLYSLLRENKVALVLVNQPLVPSVEEITTDFVYVRWEGDRKKVIGTLGRIEVDRTEDIRKWADKLKRLLEKQVEIFGYFSKYYSGFPPADAKQLLSLLQSRLIS